MWDEYKELTTANTIKNEVEGQKPNYDRYNLASSMLSYMNDSPAVISDGFNYIDDGSDAEMCRKVFKLIFQAMRQEQHYKMMMNIEDEVSINE